MLYKSISHMNRLFPFRDRGTYFFEKRDEKNVTTSRMTAFTKYLFRFFFRPSGQCTFFN